MSASDTGVALQHGCRITHGASGNIKKPFEDISLVMHELSPNNEKGFRGQLGFIEFTTEYRLPRHIHMDASMTRLVDERIMVLHGVGLVEIAGEIYAAAPGTLVDAKGGVPHTWTACPAGVKLPDGSVSDGRFTMVYEYEESTSFYPTASTKIVTKASQYEKFEGSDFDAIRFPIMDKQQVVEQASVVFDHDIHKLTLA